MQRLDDFIEDCLREHNICRSKHGVAPLIHSRSLDKSAQDWAEQLICEDSIKNSNYSIRGEVGESISVRTSTGSHVDVQGDDIVNQWYADITNYNFETGKGLAGNFTQLVWNSSREVGFGKARASGKCVVVAHYRPPGNVIGRYVENVFPAQDQDLNKSHSQEKLSPKDMPQKTVFTETVTRSNGKVYNVRREISETEDEAGKITHCINEIYDLEKPGSEKPVDFPDSNEAIIQSHNFYRKKHGTSPLLQDKELSDLAQQWADFLLKGTHLSNSGYSFKGIRVGENIGSCWSNGSITHTGQEFVDQWYREQDKYKFDDEPSTIQGIGNFTQLIWSATRYIGIGLAKKTRHEASHDKSTKTVLVCFYYPPGNVKGGFQINVRKANLD